MVKKLPKLIKEGGGGWRRQLYNISSHLRVLTSSVMLDWRLLTSLLLVATAASSSLILASRSDRVVLSWLDWETRKTKLEIILNILYQFLDKKNHSGEAKRNSTMTQLNYWATPYSRSYAYDHQQN